MIDLSANNNVIYTTFDHKPDEQDYEKLKVFLQEMDRKYNELRWYIEIRGVSEWTPTGPWKKADLGIENKEKFKKIALVGDKEIHPSMRSFIQPFQDAETQFFHTKAKGEARLFVE